MANPHDSAGPLAGEGSGVRAAGTRSGPNPYAQVALTYLRRPVSSGRNCMASLCMLVLIVMSFQFAGSSRGNDDFISMVLSLMILSSFLSNHVIQQFADSRAHLTPGFRRAHVTIAAAAALAIGILLPATFTWFTGSRSVGLAAIAMLLLGTTFWQNLSQSVWINVLFFAGLFAVFMNALGKGAVQQLVSGQSELQAAGLLILGVALTLTGGIRLLRLNEDMPAYRRVVQWLRKAARETTAEASTGESGQLPGLWDWFADRQMASLTRHSRRASVSRWSQIRRWQVGMVSGWQTGLWISAAILFLVWMTWSDKEVEVGSLPGFLTVIPPCMALAALTRRTRTIGHELCMPVDRKTYLRQLGAAAALSHLQLWLGVSLATVLWWMLAVGGRPAYADMARVLAFAGLFQVWFFGVGAWAARYRSRSVLVVIIATIIMAAHLFMPFLLFSPAADDLRSFRLPIAALFAIFGVWLAYDAYHRWLMMEY